LEDIREFIIEPIVSEFWLFAIKISVSLFEIVFSKLKERISPI